MLFLKSSSFIGQWLKNQLLRYLDGVVSPHYGRFFYISIFVLFLFLFFQQVWIVDDARLTFRAVVNFVDGYGIVWNFGERVQIFTHPLWFFVLSAVHFVSGGFIWEDNIIFSSVIANLFFSLCALFVYMKGTRGIQLGIILLFLLVLFSSHAFMVYTSSGLENALSYFLVSVCCYLLFFRRPSPLFFILCGLLFLNRADYALLLLPMCLYVWRDMGYRISVIYLPFAICIFWLLFSTWYFGFPFPNSSIAKMNIDAPRWYFIRQGFRYYELTLLRDPATLFVIFSVILFSFYDIFCRRHFTKIGSVGLGIFLYSLYILWIGGDFLEGRFFSVPFFYALCGLSFLLRSKGFLIYFPRVNSFRNLFGFKRFILSIILLSFAVSFISILHRTVMIPDLKWVNGIATERYEVTLSFIEDERNVESFSGNAPTFVEGYCCPGSFGLHSTGDKYIVSAISLSNPYLSRLPGYWGRIGHMLHPMPTDFEAWVVGASPNLADPAIDKYFSDIREVVRGDLFSLSRMKKIISINFADYKIDTPNIVHQKFSRFYPSLQKRVSLLSMKEVNQESWESNAGAARFRYFSEKIIQSLSIDFVRRKISKVTLPVSGFSSYSWSLYDGTEKIYKDSFTDVTDNPLFPLSLYDITKGIYKDSLMDIKYKKLFSFVTHSLPNELWADRLEITIDGESHIYRRMGRPILE